ncbi:aldo/keto reductase [Cryptosporangium arvum]|uniref:Putative oxidoreductase, aryl-alcohol dehydrogenase like protein n=1 Tax=Cryptosporangium arvum DSM 44712 TaxID=927661 RepID=A0A010Z6K0_9ACTN|nr:aldo/keto reductase [Cryptosporangium arvum]EXG82933.1 putative oxidoreductase, aryl-alcohol dehydrogenase like protein [Cryptosporangium arvum DSM 44712]
MNTDLPLSALGLGAAALGGEYGPIDTAVAHATVRTALDEGITLIDVSPYYGRTAAETVLGDALRGVPRDAYVLATKAGRYDVDEFDFSAERVVRSVEESLRRLRTDHVDLIQCHDIEFGDLDRIVTETVPALRGLQEKGLVGAVGITGYPLPALVSVAGRVPVDTVLSYCHYTLQNSTLGERLPFFADRGVDVLNASPLSMGLLTDAGPPGWHPAPAAVRAACAEAAAHCRERGTTIVDLALRFAVGLPGVASTIVGAADPESVRRNVRWATGPLDEQLLGEVRAILAGVHDVDWPVGLAQNR